MFRLTRGVSSSQPNVPSKNWNKLIPVENTGTEKHSTYIKLITDCIYGHFTDWRHENCSNKIILNHFVLNRTILIYLLDFIILKLSEYNTRTCIKPMWNILIVNFITNSCIWNTCVTWYWLQAPWGWHDSVETCWSVLICEIIVYLLVIVQHWKKKYIKTAGTDMSLKVWL